MALVQRATTGEAKEIDSKIRIYQQPQLSKFISNSSGLSNIFGNPHELSNVNRVLGGNENTIIDIVISQILKGTNHSIILP